MAVATQAAQADSSATRECLSKIADSVNPALRKVTGLTQLDIRRPVKVAGDWVGDPAYELSIFTPFIAQVGPSGQVGYLDLTEMSYRVFMAKIERIAAYQTMESHRDDKYGRWIVRNTVREISGLENLKSRTAAEICRSIR